MMIHVMMIIVGENRHVTYMIWVSCDMTWVSNA